MGELYLVRHGQARFLTDDYDRLSELGQQQARLLGRYWAGRKQSWDQVWCGPLNRHKQTHDAVVEQYRDCDQVIPPAQILAELAEIPAFEILQEYGPDMTTSAKLSQAEKVEAFKAQNQILRQWIGGESFGSHDSWRTCRERAEATLDRLAQSVSSGGRSVVFGSGGSICLMLAGVLGLDDEAAWDLALAMTNTSWNQLRVSSRRKTVMTFNSRPHLELDDLVTLV